MVGVTGQNRGRVVAAGLLVVLFAMTAVVASVTPDRSSTSSQAADPSAERNVLEEASRRPVPTTSVSSTSTTATVVPAPILATARRCAAGDLRLTFGSEAVGVMRQSAAYFGLKNVARMACTLRGYPAVEFFDRAGRRIDTQVRKGGGYIIHDPGAAAVTLATNATGWFGLNWVVENVEAGNLTGCVAPAVIGVAPPGSTRQLRMTVDFRAPPCLVNGPAVTAVSPGGGFGGAFTAPTPGT